MPLGIDKPNVGVLVVGGVVVDGASVGVEDEGGATPNLNPPLITGAETEVEAEVEVGAALDAREGAGAALKVKGLGVLEALLVVVDVAVPKVNFPVVAVDDFPLSLSALLLPNPVNGLAGSGAPPITGGAPFGASQHTHIVAVFSFWTMHTSHFHLFEANAHIERPLVGMVDFESV